MRFFIFFLALAGTSCAISASLTDYDDAAFEVRADSRPVPMHWTGDRGGPFGGYEIPVSFNGHVEHCLIDTGAQMSVAFANPFFDSLPKEGRAWIMGLSGRREATFFAHVDSLEIGGMAFADARFMLNERKTLRRPSFSCILGRDILAHGAVLFDFKRELFQVLREIPATRAPRPLALAENGEIHMRMVVHGLDLEALWDSGAEVSMVDAAVVAAHPGEFRLLEAVGLGSDAISETGFRLPLYATRGLQVGRLAFQDAVVAGGSVRIARNLHAQAIIGMNLIRQSNWIFDLHRRRWASF